MSVGTGVGGSDVIQGRIPLAQLGNPNQVQIIATSSVGGTVSIAGNTWAGVNLSTPIPPNVPGVSPQPIPATGTLTLGLLLLAVFALSFVAYRRRYGRYHWVLLLCLPAVFTVAWAALTWKVTFTNTKAKGSAGEIREISLANDNAYVHVKLAAHIGDGLTKPQCGIYQAVVGGSCVDLKISDIKPLAVANNQVTNFTITGQQLPNDLEVHIEECIDGQMSQRSDNMIEYQCKTTIAGEKGLVLVQNNKIVFAHKIMVSNSSNQAISLPIAPSNPNETVTGQDNNNNGVRDEVEIALANYVASADLHQKALVTAKAYQQILEKPTPTDRKQALELMSEVTCQLPKGLRIENTDSNVYTSATFNTAERKAKYSAFLNHLKDGYLGFELTPCKDISARRFNPKKLGFDIRDEGSFYNSDTKQLIIFVPGIGNDTGTDDKLGSTPKSSEALIEVLGFNANNPQYSYTYFDNPTDGILDDSTELQIQALLSNEALKKANISNPHKMTKQDKKNYYYELGKIYTDPEKTINLSWYQWVKKPALKRVKDRTKNLAEDIDFQFSFSNLDSFETLILVPHSQGNFYVEAAYALLYYQDKKDILSRIRVFGVGPVAASTPNDNYMLSDFDTVVRAGQSVNAALATKDLLRYDHLRWNYNSYVLDHCLSKKQGLTSGFKCGIDPLGHNFENAYLNKNIYRKDKNGKLIAYPFIVRENVLNYLQELKNLYIDNKITTSFSDPEIKVGVKNDLIVKLNFADTINRSDNIVSIKAKIEGIEHQLKYNASKNVWMLKDVVLNKTRNYVDLSITYVTQDNLIVPLVINKIMTISATQLTIASPSNFKARLVGKNGAVLWWDVVNDSNATGYQISKKKSGESKFTVITTITDVTTKARAVANLDYNSHYTFQIITLGKNNAKSKPVTATIDTAVTPPTTASATKLNDTGITKCGTADGTSNTADCSTAVAGATGSQVPKGQDGHYGTGKNGSKGMVFEKVSGYEDKCVLDKHTGLMWEVKQTSGLHSKENTYTWYGTTNNNGTAFVNAVNAAGWCGHNDWRLPTRKELRSIVDYSRYNPAIDTTYFPNTKNSIYWSSSPDAHYTNNAWGVRFDGGSDYNHLKDHNRYVRLVRGGL